MPTGQSDMDSPSLGHSSQVIQDSVNLPPHKYRGVLKGRDNQFIRCCRRWSSELQIFGSSDTNPSLSRSVGLSLCNEEVTENEASLEKTKSNTEQQGREIRVQWIQHHTLASNNKCGSSQLCIYSKGHLLNKAPPDNLL